MGEAEMIASFPQFYERVRELCLRFNHDAANLLVSFNIQPQEPADTFRSTIRIANHFPISSFQHDKPVVGETSEPVELAARDSTGHFGSIFSNGYGCRPNANAQ
jgi:hypothetical protein